MFLDLSKDNFPLFVNYFVFFYIIPYLFIFTFILYHICNLLFFYIIFYIFSFFILFIYFYIFIYFRPYDCTVKTTVPVIYILDLNMTDASACPLTRVVVDAFDARCAVRIAGPRRNHRVVWGRIPP